MASLSRSARQASPSGWLVLCISLPACTANVPSNFVEPPETPMQAPGAAPAPGSLGTGNVVSTSPTGSPSAPLGSGPLQPAACTGTEVPAGPAPLTRLANTEYKNTLRDLFPWVFANNVNLTLPSEIAARGFLNTARAQTPSAQLIDNLNANASIVAAAAAENLSLLSPCVPADASVEEQCGKEFVRALLAKMFRRPLGADELVRYDTFFANARAAYDFKTAARLVVQALLQSPQFLYRVEQTLGGRRALTDFELATRIAYLLTDSTPDRELLAAADAGKLQNDMSLEAEVRRLLATPRARTATADFNRQWLRFDRMDNLVKAKDLFPAFNPAVAGDLRLATERFVDHIFWDEGHDLGSLLTDSHAYVNDNLAPIYGGASPGATLTWTQVDAKERSGILTQAGLMAGLAHERNGAPVLRGVFVLDRLLCTAPPPPPADINTALPVLTSDAKMTTRQQLELSHGSPTCAGCHSAIDGAGFGFENYDALGRFRTEEFGLPVDPSGQIVGTSDADGKFNGALELGQKLAGSRQVRSCLAAQWLGYALSVTRDEIAPCQSEPLAQKLNQTKDLRELLVSLATSPAFRYVGQ